MHTLVFSIPFGVQPSYLGRAHSYALPNSSVLFSFIVGPFKHQKIPFFYVGQALPILCNHCNGQTKNRGDGTKPSK